MIRDLRHALRVLLKARGWTAVVVASLAVGIGANTALFGGVNSLLLRKLPVKDPDTLVRLRIAGQNDMSNSSSDYGTSNSAPGERVRATISYPIFKQLAEANRTLDDLFACAPYGRVNIVVNGEADVATAFISTGNYYQALGVSAHLGRTLVPDDDRPDAPAAAVLGFRYWRSKFGSDPDIVGKTVQINKVVVTIVGVLPEEFTGVQRPVATPSDLSLPLALDPQLSSGPTRLTVGTNYWLQTMGRLKPGVTFAQVEGNLGGVFQQAARDHMASYLGSLSEEARSTASNQNRTRVPRLAADSGSRGVYDPNPNDVRGVTILTGVVVVVLLIVCANVANLLLSRAIGRRREVSLRLSLGATRWRLVRQFLTESLLLAAAGGVLGVLVAYWGQQLLPGAAGQSPELDWRTLLFIVGVTTATGLVFGVVPALRATSVNVNSALKENSRGVAGSKSALSKALLVAQVALSLVLLVGAGLFLRSLENLRQVDVGFNPDNLVVFRVNPGLLRYDPKQVVPLYEDMMARLRAVPGVTGVAASHMTLLSGGANNTNMFVQGRTYAPAEQHDIHRLVVSPGFFATMQMPLVAGRGLTPADHSTAPKVAVINEGAARKYFGRENPLGLRFGSSIERNAEIEVVGVVRDAKYSSVREDVPPTMYIPYTQTNVPQTTIEVRTATDPMSVVGAIREAVRQIDPNLPVTDVATQTSLIEQRLVQERLFAQAYTVFGGVALLVASVGLFGLMSYSVARRTNEIGIRMALGARSGDVLALVMRESLVLVAVGIVMGLAGAIAAGRLIAAQLFGLAPTDAMTLAIATLVMLIVSAAAGFLPARRASRVDPMVALHDQ